MDDSPHDFVVYEVFCAPIESWEQYRAFPRRLTELGSLQKIPPDRKHCRFEALALFQTPDDSIGLGQIEKSDGGMIWSTTRQF